MLIEAIMGILESTFTNLNNRISDISTQVGQTPAGFQPSIYSSIRHLSETVILPIAGIILTFIACYELIQLVTSRNNLADVEIAVFFKWLFKTCIAVYLITNTFTITMAVFDVSQHVVTESADIIAGDLLVSEDAMDDMEDTLEDMEIGELFVVCMQTFVVKILIDIFSLLIFAIVYGRMIEIYLMISLAPIPFATFGNREQSMIGQNYLRSLFALGFQGFLIMVCIAIYAALVQSVVFSDDIIGSLWTVLGITIILAFTLFKTGTIAKSVFHAH